MTTKRRGNALQTPHSDDTAQQLFWTLASELQSHDSSLVEGTIMNGRCLRVGKEFLALVDYKGSGLVVKLPRPRIAALIAAGLGQPFAPAGRTFNEWVSVPKPDRSLWRTLLREGVVFAKRGARSHPSRR
ncbi:MAG: hypothetical protein ACREXP_24295 [Steroidobacteraceae bacterium]